MAGVGNDLDFYPVAATSSAGQPGQTHGFLCGSRARGVGQKAHVGGDMPHDALAGSLVFALFVHTAHGHGDDLRAAGFGH